jgi:hypothetical protein
MKAADMPKIPHFGITGARIVAAVTALALAPALAADPSSTPTTPAGRLESARAEIALTRNAIVQTMQQLDLVRSSSDPRAQFQQFVEQLAKMKERAKLTQERAQAMKKRGDAYFAEWEARSAEISDPEARRQAKAAHAKRKVSYDMIVEQMQLARTQFTPLLAELEQIKRLFEGEHSQENIAAAKDLFMRANWHCVDVQRAMMATERELDSLAADFSGAPAGQK